MGLKIHQSTGRAHTDVPQNLMLQGAGGPINVIAQKQSAG